MEAPASVVDGSEGRLITHFVNVTSALRASRAPWSDPPAAGCACAATARPMIIASVRVEPMKRFMVFLLPDRDPIESSEPGCLHDACCPHDLGDGNRQGSLQCSPPFSVAAGPLTPI